MVSRPKPPLHSLCGYEYSLESRRGEVNDVAGRLPCPLPCRLKRDDDGAVPGCVRRRSSLLPPRRCRLTLQLLPSAWPLTLGDRRGQAAPTSLCIRAEGDLLRPAIAAITVHPLGGGGEEDPTTIRARGLPRVLPRTVSVTS